MCAAIETLNQITQRGFYESLKEMTHTFLDPIRQIIKEKKIKATLQNVGSMFSIFFGPTRVESREDLKQLDVERFRCFFQHCFNHGLYLCPSPYEANFLSIAHTQEHLLYAQKVIVDFFLS